jgi:GlcNAc-P-P-Und epimerase
MKICVVGGSGFIGTHFVRQLLASRHDITILDKVQSAAFPDLCTLGDVRDLEALQAAFCGRDLIVNLAAEHHDNVRPESLYFDVNAGGARNICEAARANRVERIIFTSTVAIYGLTSPGANEDTAAEPFNAYGESKWQAEGIFRSWATEDSRRSLTIVRPVVVFGEDNRGNVYNLLHQIRSGRFIMVGTGKNKKSMAYIANLVDFLESLLNEPQGTLVYNYLDQPDLSARDLVSIARRAFGLRTNGVSVPYWVGLAGGTFFDILARLTGRQLPISAVRVRKFCSETVVSAARLVEREFKPRYSLQEGLERTIQYEFSKTERARRSGDC